MNQALQSCVETPLKMSVLAGVDPSRVANPHMIIGTKVLIRAFFCPKLFSFPLRYLSIKLD